MFNQSEYKGFNTKKMEKDFKRITKQYMKIGNKQPAAEQKAKEYVDYYKHQYRVFA